MKWEFVQCRAEQSGSAKWEKCNPWSVWI